MALNRIPEFEYLFWESLENRRLQWGISPIYLGGSQGGENGGSGQPPGGFIGFLTQRRVSYDTTEIASFGNNDEVSLLDNLNHLRAMALAAGEVHGLASWQVLAGCTSIELIDFWDSIDWVTVNGAMLTPTLFSLNSENSKIVFDTALIGNSVVVAQGVVLRT